MIKENKWTSDFPDAMKAMDILTKFYPNKKHMFVFDNATTHATRSDTALSA
jgi:hypothetical protein